MTGLTPIVFIPLKPIAVPFKAVPGGYVFRAPTIAITGRASHYFVDQTQKEQIELIQKSMNPVRSLIALVVWYILSLVALVVLLSAMPDALTVPVIAPFLAAMLLLPLIARHVLIRRQLKQLHPILSHAKPTDQVISNDEILAVARGAVSLNQTWGSALLVGALSLAQLAMMVANRNPKVAMLSDANMIPWALQFVLYGLLAMAFFKAALDKIASTSPPVVIEPSFLSAPSREVVLTVATIMAGVAVMLLIIAWSSAAVASRPVCRVDPSCSFP